VKLGIQKKVASCVPASGTPTPLACRQEASEPTVDCAIPIPSLWKSNSSFLEKGPLQLRLDRGYAAFTLVELLVTITIVIALAALAFTGSSKLTASAQETDAANDLRAIHAATVLYTTENNGELFFVFDQGGPNGWQNLWIDKLSENLPGEGKVTHFSGRSSAFYNKKIKESSMSRWIADYAPNDNVILSRDVNNPRFPLRISRIQNPSQEVMFVEGANYAPPGKLANNTGAFTIWAQEAVKGNREYPNTIARRHGPGASPAFYAVFCDGHTERISYNEFFRNRQKRKTMFSANDNGDTIYAP
jgi:type II secretory pathway pseudopilin PulG